MNFTREPIVETIITPREGCKIVVRNSKGVGQEEYFVDAVEIVSFGNAHFYRSLERPKCFLVPVTDYEVLEVRETRMVLKHVVNTEKGIKIGGGREAPQRAPRESREAVVSETPAESEGVPATQEAQAETRSDRKRDRSRRRRRRGGREDGQAEQTGTSPRGDELTAENEPHETTGQTVVAPPTFSHLIPPPTTLISESLARYKSTLPKEALLLEEEEGQEESEGTVFRNAREPLPPMFDSEEAPQLLPHEPSSQSEPEESAPRRSGFSPSSLLRRFRKREEGEPLDEPKGSSEENFDE